MKLSLIFQTNRKGKLPHIFLFMYHHLITFWATFLSYVNAKNGFIRPKKKKEKKERDSDFKILDSHGDLS